MRTSELQEQILTQLLKSRPEVWVSFMKCYLDLGEPTTVQAFGRSVQACFRREWITERTMDDGLREIAITPEGEVAFAGGVLDPQVDRDRWKIVREPYIGSSDVAAILGIHEYGKGPWDVWDRIVTGQWHEPRQVGADIRRGNRQESNAMDRFYEVTGLETRAASMLHHPGSHFLVSDMDEVILPTKNWPEHLRSNPLWERVIQISEDGGELAHEVKCPRTSIFYDCKSCLIVEDIEVQRIPAEHEIVHGELDVVTLSDVTEE